MDKRRTPTPEERDEPLKIDLDPEQALRALLKVDPEAKPAKDPGEAKAGPEPTQ